VKTYLILIYQASWADPAHYYAALTGDEALLVRDLLSLKVRHNKIDRYSVEVFAPISYPELMKYIDEVGE
jgi:hypothetical protein